jgi:restriction system protein
MSDQSLFAILMRSAWWISAGIALALILMAQALLPDPYRVPGTAMAFPFVIIAGIAIWKQFEAPSTRRIERTFAAVRAMSWRDFGRAIEDAYRRDGFEVSRVNGTAADFALTKGGRTTLVSCKGWKVARTGIAPLRDLLAAKEAREAQECIHISTGEISDNARQFAVAQNIRLLGGPELARLLPDLQLDRA